MGSFVYEKAEKEPYYLDLSTSYSKKYGALFEYIQEQKKSGSLIKITVNEANRYLLEKSVHTLQTSLRAWRARIWKNSPPSQSPVYFRQRKIFISDTVAEVWITITSVQK